MTVCDERADNSIGVSGHRSGAAARTKTSCSQLLFRGDILMTPLLLTVEKSGW